MQRQLVKKLIPGLPATKEDGSPNPVPTQLPWYPAGMGWNMVSDRKAIRSNPEYAAFHQWLTAAKEHGDVSRQEAVSMVPPLLMDIQPDHLVLDLCAAPGSKTAQLIEMLHSGCAPGTMPRGLVIANDLDQERAYLLHHQVKRILSPALLVTNNDGALFPNLYLGDSDEAVQFDRILADVPCTGDGTLRKNPAIWKDWTPGMAVGLHGLQVRLLDRAVQMLRVGGRVVYSTCSLSPLEDEAVVAALLARYPGRLRLVDCSAALPALQRRPGVAHWHVTSRNGRETYEALAAVPEAEQRRYSETMFPQPGYAGLHLDRCMRILPHQQDTGGFFIAVLEKVAELAAGSEQQRRRTRQPDEPAAAPRPVREDEYSVVEYGHPNLAGILEQYGIDAARLHALGAGFVTRGARDPLKILVMVSELAKALLLGGNARLRLVNVGARAFEIYDVKRDIPCAYRVLSESAPFFQELGLITRRVARVPAAGIRLLLATEDSLSVEQACQGDEAARTAIQQWGEGGFLLVTTSALSQNDVVVPAWKGVANLRSFIPKANRPALLYQLEY